MRTPFQLHIIQIFRHTSKQTKSQCIRKTLRQILKSQKITSYTLEKNLEKIVLLYSAHPQKQRKKNDKRFVVYSKRGKKKTFLLF